MPKRLPIRLRLSHPVKAEVLAATFHLLTDHMPEIWKTVPAWLQAQIKQAMCDCSIEHKDFSEQELEDCVDYCQWLNKKYPQPKLKKKRYLHFALSSHGEGSVGQYGCAWGTSLEDVKKNIDPRDHGNLVRVPQKDCFLCKEDKK